MLQADLRQVSHSAKRRGGEGHIRDYRKRWEIGANSLEFHCPARSVGRRVDKCDRDRMDMKQLLQVIPRLRDHHPLMVRDHVLEVS